MNLKNVDLGKFATFKLLAKEGSFAAASKVSGMTYSSLNHDMSSLEKGLNQKLYHPTKRKFVPTAEGLALLKLFEEFIVKLQQTDSDNKEAYVCSELTICSTVTINHYLVVQTVKALQEKYPQTHFKLLSGPEYTKQANYDLDVDILIGPSPTHRPDMAQREIWTSHYGYFASDKYLKKYSPIHTVSDLKGHKFLLFSGHHDIDPKILSVNETFITCNSYLALAEACRFGLGVLSFPVDLMAQLQDLQPTQYNCVQRILPGHICEEDFVKFSYKRFSEKHEIIKDFFETVKRVIPQVFGHYPQS